MIDKADSWMGLCEVKFRDPEKRDMELFGVCETEWKDHHEKVNDNPQSREREWGWLQASAALDIYGNGYDQ